MFSAAIHELLLEISGDPGRFAIEVVQFVILVGIGYVVMFGFGKRKGMVVNMLSERRRRIADRVERAGHADDALAQAREAAAVRLEDARAEAAGILRGTRATAKASRRDTRAAVDAAADAIRARAAAVLDEEFAEMYVEIRDRLVGVVAQATRSLLNEGLSPQEQRELIQGVVAGGLDRLERSMEDDTGGARR